MDPNANNNLQWSESLNVSSGSLFTSTPFKVPFARGRNAASKKKVYVRPVCDTCQLCGKEYRCHRSYLNHMKQHSIKDAASRFPSATQITEHCASTVFEVVQGLQAKPAHAKMGVRYKNLLYYIVSNRDSICLAPEWNECFRIIHEAVTEEIGEHKILLPSVLLNSLGKKCESILSDVEERKHLCALLKACVVSDDDVLHSFVADYTLMLVTKIFLFYSSCLKNNVSDSVDMLVELDEEDKEAIHYISGSVVRGFYKKSLLFPKNLGWSKIHKLIVEKLLESDTVPGPPASVKGWTTAQSKGKLFFVSGLLFDFMCGVAEILEKTSHIKLRVDAAHVIESVCRGCVILLWDEAVGDSISESASYDLMCGMVRSFCTTYGVGKSKKLINKIRSNKAEASIALRVRVAPKS